MQFYLIIDEIKTMSQHAMTYLNNLKIELNSLSVNQLSIHTISPLELKTILLNIQAKSPDNFKLPVNPENNIWHFYKVVSCLAYLQDNEISIMMKIPLINTKQQYRIYKIYNLPMPVYTTNQGVFTVQYQLESNNLMISEDRRKYVLLTDHEFEMCSNTDINFCTHKQALYTTSFSKSCIIALISAIRLKLRIYVQKVFLITKT